MFGAIIQSLEEFEEKYHSSSAEEQEKITNEIGGTLTPEEPPREDPDEFAPSYPVSAEVTLVVLM